MKIDKTFKIKEKYFNAILRYEKPLTYRGLLINRKVVKL